jgi:hypothetical protein
MSAVDKSRQPRPAVDISGVDDLPGDLTGTGMRSHGHQKPLATSGAKTSAFFVVPGMGGDDSIPATITLELELHVSPLFGCAVLETW